MNGINTVAVNPAIWTLADYPDFVADLEFHNVNIVNHREIFVKPCGRGQAPTLRAAATLSFEGKNSGGFGGGGFGRILVGLEVSKARVYDQWRYLAISSP